MADLCFGIDATVGSTSNEAICTHKTAVAIGGLEIGRRVIAGNERASVSQIVLPFALYVVNTLLPSRVFQVGIAPNVRPSLVDVCGVLIIQDSSGDIRRCGSGQNVVDNTTAIS